ncbi:LacI family DNA-binding transcriptional regulator [Streptomyces werraensis]|uniref:LacI family DNA-binding transcriptional regulator n=1 Tax=Streptomyces werraensis TaxID=68284 RepID=UPI003434CD54
MGRTGRARTAAGPTLAVVAREAGVSVPTASKVVNGREDVAPETRRRVTEALDRLGYVRRPRFAGAGTTPLVDLVVNTLDDPASGAVLHGAEAAAHDAGLEVVVCAARTRTGSERPGRTWQERLVLRGSAGVLFHLAEPSPAQYAWLEQHRVPLALIDPACEPPPGAVSVGGANWQGGVTATEHLLALGHERVAVITGPAGPTLSGRARLAGYRSALANAGVRHRPEYTRHADGTDDASVRRAVRELLDLPQPPTAAFLCSDRTAPGVYGALAERGLRVPDDMSVVGFDDLPEVRRLSPPLTTVRQPLAEMAATALHLLLRMRDGHLPESTRTELSTRLVERASTAPPPVPPLGRPAAVLLGGTAPWGEVSGPRPR